MYTFALFLLDITEGIYEKSDGRFSNNTTIPSRDSGHSFASVDMDSEPFYRGNCG